jgi:hypothetical protein
VAFRCLERRSSKPIASWGSDGVVDVLVGLEVFDEALAVGDLYAVEASYSSGLPEPVVLVVKNFAHLSARM